MAQMKSVLGLLSVLVLSNAVFAQDEPKRDGERGRNAPRREERGGRRPDMAGAFAMRLPLMMALDADQDGSLSASEIEYSAKALAKLDKDGDGILSSEELRPSQDQMNPEMRARLGQAAGGGQGKEMMSQMFEQRDADGDGKLSGDEIPERLKQMLSRIDENGDGDLDKSEMQKAMQKMGDRAGQRPGRGGQKDKDGGAVAPKRPPVE